MHEIFYVGYSPSWTFGRESYFALLRNRDMINSLTTTYIALICSSNLPCLPVGGFLYHQSLNLLTWANFGPNLLRAVYNVSGHFRKQPLALG